MIIYLSAVALVMKCHRLFFLTYATPEGQELTFKQVCHSLNLANVFQLEQVELPIDIQSCPRKNTTAFVVSKIKNLDQSMYDHFPQFGKLPEIGKDQTNHIVAITNIHKFNEGLHHLSLTRQYELMKKRSQNKFPSNAAYYKSCQKSPRRTRIFLQYIENVGETWREFEHEHGIPTPTDGILFLLAKIPSANCSLKDPGGFHHVMLALSKTPNDSMGPAYLGPLRHIIGTYIIPLQQNLELFFIGMNQN